MRRHIRNHLIWAFAAACVPASATSAEEPKIVYRPIQIGAMHEFGRLEKGIFQAGSSASKVWQDQWLDHFAASLTQQVVVDDRLLLSAGIGGVFQFRQPETVGQGFGYHQRKGFFSGPTDVTATYSWGDLDRPWLKLGVGNFPYKYNPEASNLGEYLFRAGPYPTWLNTGGYVLVGSAGASLQGLRAQFAKGNLKADVFLITETSLAPLYDWSLAAVVGYTFGDGLLDLGAGVHFKRLIPVKPSRSVWKDKDNGYFTYHGQDYTSNRGYYSNQVDFYTAKITAAQEALAAGGDAATLNAQIAKWQGLKAVGDSGLAANDYLESFADSAGGPRVDYYPSKGILLMARATLDLKKLFDSDRFGANDLKIFSEVDVLGAQNYPVFYDKITDRMPIMFGINLPGFRWLDLISLQGEYFKTPWMNNTYAVGLKAGAYAYYPTLDDTFMSKDSYFDAPERNAFKWSLLVQKKIGPRFTVSGQVASDHMKLTSSTYYYGPQFDHNEVTAHPSHWYWMTQFSWGI